ncbi:HNH endonuclease signature motif containing protein [Comamonas testosteroni]|uniref:HNH endonuclease signature motif containing protein n=1 Tax=Comamonas testosteroni TaxID=285 RepID=UPI002DBF3E07|nr:HNH endonuclease signature motif containing protein [Comamonas testosteroni]MEB5964510.1 HNH endonuclease [Comamonas testosteroni]
MQRDTGLCQPCLKLGALSVAQEVDHLVPKAQGKRLGWTREQMDAKENLQAICKACHAVKTAREARGLFTSLMP